MTFHWTPPKFGPGIIDQQNFIFYGRWSDPSQGAGTSEERQTGEKLVVYLAKMGKTLDDVKIVIDDGFSAFSAAHRLKGQLSDILAKAKAGKLKGWHLIAEAPDRLSRENEVESIGMLADLVRWGVCVHVLSLDAYVTTQSKNLMFLMQWLVGSATAHEESSKKQERILFSKASHRELILDGKEGKNRTPCWYEMIYDTKTGQRTAKKLIKDRVLTLERMFELGLLDMGGTSIAVMLNLEGHKTFSEGWVYRKGKKKGQLMQTKWTQASVYHFLTNPAVVGWYQMMMLDPDRPKGSRRSIPVGDPVLYYDEIISPAVFKKVNDLIKDRSDRNGNSTPHSTAAKNRNILHKIFRCGHCGAAMVLGWKNQRNFTQARCANAHNAAGQHKLYYNFDKILGGVFNVVAKADFSETEQAEDVRILEAELAKVSDAKARLINKRRVWADAEVIDAFERGEIRKLTKQIMTCEGEEHVLRADIQNARGHRPPVDDRKAELRAMLGRINITDMDASPETVEARGELRNKLREFVELVECIDPELKPQAHGFNRDRQIHVTLVGQEDFRYVLDRTGELKRRITARSAA